MEYVFFMGKPGQFFQKICFVSKNAVNEEVSLYGIIYQREFDEDQVIGNLAISPSELIILNKKKAVNLRDKTHYP